MIKNKVKVLYKCKQGIHIQDNGKIVKNMEKEYINLVIKIIMRDNLYKVWDLVKESINGLMVVFMMDNGKLIKWMVEVFIVVLMDLSLKVYFKMII